MSHSHPIMNGCGHMKNVSTFFLRETSVNLIHIVKEHSETIDIIHDIWRIIKIYYTSTTNHG